MAVPTPSHDPLSETASMDLQKLLLELGIKSGKTASSASKPNNIDSHEANSSKEQDQDSTSDSDDPHSDTDSEADTNSAPGHDREDPVETLLAKGRDLPLHGTAPEPIDDPDATDSDPDMRLGQRRPEPTRPGENPLQTAQKKKKHFVRFTIDWETRGQWLEQLERKEIISFLKNNCYRPSENGYSDYTQVEEFQCSRYGRSRPRKAIRDDQGNIIPYEPKRLRDPSIKVGCTSTLKIKQLKSNPTKAHVMYYDEHRGHTPRTIQGLKSQRKSRKFIRTLRQLADEGMDPEQILQKYSIDPSTVFDRVQNRIGIHPNDFVTRDTLYPVMYERMMKRRHVQASVFGLLEQKAKDMQDEGYFMFNKTYPPQLPMNKGKDKGKGRSDANADSESGMESGMSEIIETAVVGTPLFAFGFLHPWQQQLLLKYGDSIGLDCLHKATQHNLNIYTIIIRHRHGHGVPAGFLVTNDYTARPLRDWMSTLKEELKLCPKYIVMDESTYDLRVFEGDNLFNTATTSLCTWHAVKAWRRQARSAAVPFPDDNGNDSGNDNDNDDDRKLLDLILHGSSQKDRQSLPKKRSGPDSDPENRAINRIVKELRRIAFLKDINAAEASLRELENTLEDQQPSFWRLFRQKWLANDKPTLWLMAYREGKDYGPMSTNNFVQNWNDMLRRRFLYRRSDSSVDQLVDILQHPVISHFQHETAVLHLGTDQMKAQERQQRSVEKEVEALVESGHLNELISRSENGYTVKSFKKPDVEYQVSVVEKEITKCSCLFFVPQHAVCKHMYAVLRTSDRALTLIYSTENDDLPRPNNAALQRQSEREQEVDEVVSVIHMTGLRMQDFIKSSKRVSTSDISPTLAVKRKLQ